MVKSSILEELLVMKLFLMINLIETTFLASFFSIKSICKSVNLFISSFALKRTFSLNRLNILKLFGTFRISCNSDS